MDAPIVGTAVLQTCEVAITGLSHDGQGVGRLDDGQVVFVPDLLPGERARVRIVQRARRHLIGHCQERLSDNPQRRRPPCILADHCGGCSLQHLDHQGQLASKHDMVAQALGRIGSVSLQPDPVLGSASDLGYRNRTVIPLERCADGRLRAGFYRRGSHQIVNMNHCPVLDPRLDALIEPLKRDLELSDWPVDRHRRADGGLRHLALRIGHHSGEILITLIASHDRFEGLDALARTWLERWPAVVGVVLNLQPQPSNTLFGAQTLLLAGRDWLSERFCGLRFQLGCDTFFQVNTPQAERVLPLLLEALPAGESALVDAYCGVGAFSLPLAAAGHRVTGLELQGAAVDLARSNAQINNLAAKASFQQGPVAEHLATLLPQSDAVLVDPPRKGLEAAVRDALIQHPVSRLLYLSCDPATLARDLGMLLAGPYRLERVQPFDFFPNTSHVECLAVLSS
ncbi:MAG: 23S rRNA (uracil(1939)-C(5))-methyltransferase RlmD [Cyanobacteriota bacterium]|nr:23S rRNA (uracil(1939)-C(5))-methyltransferase RlmD [Cyanobacteriota bacterium]